MLELEDNNFKEVIVNVFRRLKETMFKELKESMMMMMIHELKNFTQRQKL